MRQASGGVSHIAAWAVGMLALGTLALGVLTLGVAATTQTAGHAAAPALRFTSAPDVPVSAGPAAIALADLNGDGVADLVVANSASATVTVRLGSSDGGFEGPHGFAVGAGPIAVAVADLNRDGKPDIIATTTAGNGKPVYVNVLLGKGDGSFAARRLYRFASDVGAYRMAPLAVAT